MDRKKSVPDAMESSDDGDSGSESSGEDEFDSADERLNQVPAKALALTLTTQEEGSDHTDSSDESDSESDEKPIKLAVNPAGSEAIKTQTQQSKGASEILEAVKSFDSDPEPDYDRESSSESEGLTQKSALAQNRKGTMNGNAIKAVESLPVGQKQGQKDELPAKKGKVEDAKKEKAEDDQSAKKGKAEALKQQQKDPPRAKKGKNEGLKQVQEEDHPSKKSKSDALKQTQKDDQSMKKEKKENHLAKKGKGESLKHDREVDSDGKESARKRKKESATADSEHMGDANQERLRVAVASNDVHSLKTGHEKSMSTQNGDTKAADRSKPAHALSHDTDKEISRKAKSDPVARANSSRNEPDRKVSKAESEGKHEKKALNHAVKEPSSPQKQRKSPHVWSPEEEIVMVSEVLNRVKSGMEIPSKRNNDFWVKLSETLQGKLDVEFSEQQLCEKVRRMKLRYHNMVHKMKESKDVQKPYKHKNASDQGLFDIWSQLWGRAEVTNLEDKEEAAAAVAAAAAAKLREELAKPVVAVASPFKEGKSAHAKKGLDVHKGRPSLETKVSEEDEGSDDDESVGREDLEGNRITTTPMELDKKEASTQGDGSHKAPSDITPLPIVAADGKFDVYKYLQDEIRVSLHELQEWSKQGLEEWMNKAMTLIESAVKVLADQTRQMNGMGFGLTTAGGLPFRSWDLMENGEQAFQQQWYELHLQELNIYSQRLQLMQKECELKQEQLKLQLQLERGKQS